MVDAVVGKYTDSFGVRLASSLGCEAIDFRTEYYPDGEAHPRILADYDRLRGKDIVIVYRRRQRTGRDEVARHFHNLERLVGALKDKELYAAGSVSVLMPYYLLARQDHNPRTDEDGMVRERDEGCDIGYRYVSRVMKALGAADIVTFNPHFHRGEGRIEIEGLPVHCLSAVRELAQYAQDKISDNVYIVGPDGSAGPMVKEFASIVNRPVAVFGKRRQTGEDVVHLGEERDFQGFDVVIVDDIMSTLGTVMTAQDAMKNCGAIDVYATHAILPQIGHDRAQHLTRPNGPIRRIVATDTIKSDWSHVSVIDRLVEHYRNSGT